MKTGSCKMMEKQDAIILMELWKRVILHHRLPGQQNIVSPIHLTGDILAKKLCLSPLSQKNNVSVVFTCHVL